VIFELLSTEHEQLVFLSKNKIVTSRYGPTIAGSTKSITMLPGLESSIPFGNSEDIPLLSKQKVNKFRRIMGGIG
jgi:hypothetical protein